MTDEQRIALLESTVSMLGEHFDHLQIMVTWDEGRQEPITRRLFRGGGNWYARLGLAHEFISEGEGDILADKINQPPDNGEEDFA